MLINFKEFSLLQSEFYILKEDEVTPEQIKRGLENKEYKIGFAENYEIPDDDDYDLSMEQYVIVDKNGCILAVASEATAVTEHGEEEINLEFKSINLS